MAVMPLAAASSESVPPPASPRETDKHYWLRMAAAGSLGASGVLLMSGKRRAGLVTAVAGTALTVLDQKETARDWWNRLPSYLGKLQKILARAQGAVDELSAQRERLSKILQH